MPPTCCGPGPPRRPCAPRHASATAAPTPVIDAAELLLRANAQAGTRRSGVTGDDFLLAIAGLWQLDPRDDWRPRAARLLDLVMDGLRTGAPGRRRVGSAR